jgi:hypothetical protein
MLKRARDIKLDQLREIRLLSACGDSGLHAVARAGDVVHVEAGTTLDHGNERNSQFFILMTGEATTGVEDLCPGDTFGVKRMLGGTDEGGELRMVTDGNVLVVGQREFSSLLRRVPGFAAGVAKALATR